MKPKTDTLRVSRPHTHLYLVDASRVMVMVHAAAVVCLDSISAGIV